ERRIVRYPTGSAIRAHEGSTIGLGWLRDRSRRCGHPLLYGFCRRYPKHLRHRDEEDRGEPDERADDDNGRRNAALAFAEGEQFVNLATSPLGPIRQSLLDPTPRLGGTGAIPPAAVTEE